MGDKEGLYWRILFAIGPTWLFFIVVVGGLAILHFAQDWALKFWR